MKEFHLFLLVVLTMEATMAFGIDLDGRELSSLSILLPDNPNGPQLAPPATVSSAPVLDQTASSPMSQTMPASEELLPVTSKAPDHVTGGSASQPSGNAADNVNNSRVNPNKHTSILTMTASSAGKIRTIVATETLEVIAGQPDTQLNANNVPSYAGSSGNSSSANSTKPLITTAIVLGSVLITGIGIWIFRKWKVSPSPDFQEKLANVDYFKPPGHHDRNTVFLRELNEP